MHQRHGKNGEKGVSDLFIRKRSLPVCRDLFTQTVKGAMALSRTTGVKDCLGLGMPL